MPCARMGDRLRSRDSRNNSNKCYSVFFEDENNSKEKIRSPPKKRESPKKKKVTGSAVVVGDSFKDTAIVSKEKRYENEVVAVVKDEEEHVLPLDVKSESFECNKRKFVPSTDAVQVKKLKLCTIKDQMFEVFQPWALKTYGDQAKTKTITLRKKHRILKALDGKEQNNPDSSKFRFWVKSKGFTIQRPETFCDGLVIRTFQEQDTPKDHIDLFVASTVKDFGEKAYRKVAVVEEFFEIIYNVHVELGGRSGRHAGQKRTYRIITETYAFLPREAVTKFLSSCPACKKNLRPFSPSRLDDTFNESSLEFEALNYSSQNDSSVDSTQHGPIVKIRKNSAGKASPLVTNSFPIETPDRSTCDIESKSVTYFDEICSKINEQPKLNEIKTIAGASPNYYQILKKFCTMPNRSGTLTPKIENECDRNSSVTTNSENLDSSVDLTMNQASSIKINIGNSFGINSSTETERVEKVEKIFINSVDVSINMSNLRNELKISCKTTPPKKRYSVYIPSPPLPPLPSPEVESCAINLRKKFSKVDATPEAAVQVDLRKVKPITSTYLRMTRSFGLSDEDALKIDDLESLPTSAPEPMLPDPSPDDAYAGLMKDADKLKLMLLAWNYQNSNAVRNGSEGPDLGVVGGLWAQYQNALALNAKQPSVSPVNRAEQSSPIENQDETNSSGQKDEDDGSEDDSDDKLDQNAQDPERLKAFNMFVRLFVDENLDRMIPISKQPKEKIQAIIDSCARQFPEFCERSRKRIRTYLKSCRRNKKAREGWDNTSRPTPAHLTSVQAEQILAIACENESMNAKRMRIGLDPISQTLPMPSNSAITSDSIAPSISYPGFRTTPNTTVSTSDMDTTLPSTTIQTIPSARNSPLGLTSTSSSIDTKPNSTTLINGTASSQIASPLYRPTEFTSPSSTSSPYSTSRAPPSYPTFFSSSATANVTPTDLSMKQHVQPSSQQSNQPLQTLSSTATGSVSTGRPPLLSHKLNPNEMNAVRQLITGYRESAAFLLRSADELEQLLLQQQ